MSGKFALIIGNTEYTDPGLAQLTAPGKDTEDFARVLKDQEIGAFDDVSILLNQPEPIVRGAIDEFFDQKKPDDLLVLYFSGHGVRDELGALFLAVKNTIRSRLRSTAVKSDYIREVMDQSRSRRQVLILDCCNSGAFSQGTKAATGVSIGTASAFESGFGRIILTASDSTQFAWEGDKVIGETDNSLFTHYLVEGLEGEADLDGDGRITVDELYDYAYEKVKLATPKQTPSKFSSKQQGEIVLRQSMRIEDMKSVPLPTPLLDSIENPFSDVRLGAVQQLIKLLKGKNLGLARSAREALEHIAENDDSRQVLRAAAQALESVREVEKPAINAEPEIDTKEAQGIIHERAMETGKAKEKNVAVAESTSRLENILLSRWRTLLWIATGWGIAFTIIFLFTTFATEAGWAVDPVTGFPIAFAVIGAIGGLTTATSLRLEKIFFSWDRIFWITLAWAVGWAIGGAIFIAVDKGILTIGEQTGFPLAFAVAGVIGGFTTAMVLRLEQKLVSWKSVFWVALGWVSGCVIGMEINWLNQSPGGLLFGSAIGGALGGFVMIWQILKDTSESKEGVAKFSKPSQIKLTETQKAFLLSWKGRMLLGGMVGTIVVFTAWLLEGFFTPASLIAVFTGSVAGLITYPHKLSIVLLTLGFMILGITEPDTPVTFIAIGVVAGLPLGALASRILYWLKVLK